MFNKNDPYKTSLTGRSAVIEKKNISKHSNRIKTPPIISPRIRHFADRPTRIDNDTGIYDNGDKIEGRTGVTVELNPEEVYYRSRLKEVKNKVLNNPEKKNKPIGKIFGDVGLSNHIYSNLHRGGKYSKNKRSQKTKSRNFRKTRHRSRV